MIRQEKIDWVDQIRLSALGRLDRLGRLYILDLIRSGQIRHQVERILQKRLDTILGKRLDKILDKILDAILDTLLDTILDNIMLGNFQTRYQIREWKLFRISDRAEII